jgi:uncharacterized protein
MATAQLENTPMTPLRCARISGGLTRRALCASGPGLIALSTTLTAGAAVMPGSPAGAVRDPIERYAEAWTRGDLRSITACYHDDFVLHYFGRHALAGVHVGKAAALRALAEFSRRTGRELVAVVGTLRGAERGAIVAREKLGPERIEVERVLVYSFADGLLKECWVYDQDQRLIDRLVGAD